MKTKVFFFFIIFIGCISCGVVDRPEIPLTKMEHTFFDQLNHTPFMLDSMKREIEINRVMWDVYAKYVIVKLYSYSTNKNLSINERDSISDQIAYFYSSQKIENIQFSSCIIYYMRDKNKDKYFYAYDFEKDSIKLTNKSYKLKEK